MKTRTKILTILLSIASLMLFSCNGESPEEIPEHPGKKPPEQEIIPEEPKQEGLVESISLNHQTYDLYLNDVVKLTYTISPKVVKNKEVVFSSSNNDIASVNKLGYVSGIRLGQAIITCATTDGSNLKAECIINVIEVGVEKIDINRTSVNIFVGETFDLETTVYPSNATNKDVMFSMLGDGFEIQELNNNVCRISGVSEGRGLIFVCDHNNKLFNRCAVFVSSIPLQSFDIGIDSLDLRVGDEYTLSPSFTPSNASNKNVDWEIENPSIVSIDGEKLKALKAGTTILTGITEDGKFTDSLTITVSEQQSISKTNLKYTYKDVDDNYWFNKGSSPSIGKSKILVVPVWFKDSGNFISTSKKELVREDIDKAFFGNVTNYYSVSEFYKIESFNKLSIEGITADWYECKNNYSHYAIDELGDITLNLINEIWTYAKANWSINPKDFDMDNDGHVDGLCLIYAGPDSASYGNEAYENMWAYTSWTDNQKNVSSPTISNFIWSSYDFMYGSNVAITRTGKSYSNGNTKYCELDTHAFIHEFGHMLGLDDYYDYSENQYTPAGGFSMQDMNLGNHDPFSVMSLGWCNPYIPTSSCSIDIKPFVDSGDLILLSSSWNKDDSPFDEYILLELYTPTKLNEFDSTHTLYTGYPKGPSKCGIRLWHVDARLAYSKTASFSISKLTTNPSTTLGNVVEAMSNTYDKDFNAFESNTYVKYNLLQYIRNNTSSGLTPTDYMSNTNMFVTGDSFSLGAYSKQFVKGTTLNNGNIFPWTISFDMVSNDKATISLTRI